MTLTPEMQMFLAVWIVFDEVAGRMPRRPPGGYLEQEAGRMSVLAVPVAEQLGMGVNQMRHTLASLRREGLSHEDALTFLAE